MNGGTHIALQSWTPSSAIATGDAWNTLRVIVNGRNLYFYINGVLVWSGWDSSLTVGRVGIGMYRDDSSTNNRLSVDCVKRQLEDFVGHSGVTLERGRQMASDRMSYSIHLSLLSSWRYE